MKEIYTIKIVWELGRMVRKKVISEIKDFLFMRNEIEYKIKEEDNFLSSKLWISIESYNKEEIEHIKNMLSQYQKELQDILN